MSNFKNIGSYLLPSLLLLLCLSNCKEIPPDIDFTLPCEDLFDTTYLASATEVPQQKIVLMEEFTGVRCLPCVKGHEKADELLAKYPTELVIVEIHNTSLFSEPFPNSNHDFRTSEGDAIDVMFGSISNWPTGVVDRKVFFGQTDVLLVLGKWESAIDEEVTDTPVVNISIANTYFPDQREVVSRIKLHYTTAVSRKSNLSIMITEDDIIDPQITSSGVDNNYIHKHVLRAMMTPYNGVSVSENTEQGRVIIKEFCYRNIPTKWDVNNCNIVAFVHYQSIDSLDVLQVASEPLK